MKKKITQVSLLGILLATLFACNPIEPEQKPVQVIPQTDDTELPTPKPPSDDPSPTDEDIEFDITIDENVNMVLYPSEKVSPISVPFSVIAEKQLPSLNVTIEPSTGIEASVSVNEDNMGGTILVNGTEQMGKWYSQLTLKASYGNHKVEKKLNFETAKLICTVEDLKFSYVKGQKEINVTTNIDYLIEIDEQVSSFVSTYKTKDKLVLTISENTDFPDRYGSITLKDPQEVLESIIIKFSQAGIQGNMTTDSLALVKIYNELDLQNIIMSGYNGYMENWLTDMPVKTWLGIREYNNRVTGLNLDLFHKEGQWAEYTYPLPEAIGELKKLIDLRIYGKIAGELPKSLGDLYNLSYIEIIGPNKVTGNLAEHPIQKCSKQIKYWVIHGIFQGGVPEWFSDFKSFRFEDSAFSGKVPEKVVNHSSMQDHKSNRWNDDGTVLFPFINADIILKDIDYHTLEIWDWSKYAIWCDIDMPEGVIEVDGQYGKHYEWESEEALVKYLEKVRGYTDIRENTGYPQDKEHKDYNDTYRALFN